MAASTDWSQNLARFAPPPLQPNTGTMADDEAGTYAALRAAFDDVITPTLQRHGGRTVKSTGARALAKLRASYADAVGGERR